MRPQVESARESGNGPVAAQQRRSAGRGAQQPPPGENIRRWQDVRDAMAERGLDALLVSSPENVYYLTGLRHQGYFAFTVLVVPVDGDPLLVTRSMEEITVTEQAAGVRHVGFDDHEEPVAGASRAVRAAGLAGGRVGVEKANMFFPIGVYDGLRGTHPSIDWVDGSGVVDGVRVVKSAWEIDRIRQAAALSDRGVRAGMQVTGVGVNEREVAAAIYHSLVLGGSEYPGFAPLVRSTDNLLHEHETWRDRVLTPGEGLLMELSASVARYHAPLTRLVHVGRSPDGLDRSAEVARAGLQAITGALRPGVTTGEVYRTWKATVDARLGHDYRRHHCGYTVGIGFPPSWVGGSTVVGIRPEGEIVVREGMVFHLLSWLLDQDGLPDYAVSDTAVITADGCELLTSCNRAPVVIS